MACKETVNAAAVVQVRFEKHFHGFQLCVRLFKLISFEIQTKIMQMQYNVCVAKDMMNVPTQLYPAE